MNYSRRQFGRTVVVGIPFASALFSSRSLLAADKPNSVFNGVQIGVIIPYGYHGMASDAQSLLDDMVGWLPCPHPGHADHVGSAHERTESSPKTMGGTWHGATEIRQSRKCFS
jgi:hypothetical protein